MGVDPGTAILGYGIVSQQGNKFKVIGHGCIRTKAGQESNQRLAIIYEELAQVIVQYQPHEIAVEEIFFSKNVKTAMSVAQARGVVLLNAAHANVAVSEYKPNEVKLAVCGYGNADKKQVQEMVKKLLNMAEIVKPDDAADALAIALCHLQTNKIYKVKK